MADHECEHFLAAAVKRFVRDDIAQEDVALLVMKAHQRLVVTQEVIAILKFPHGIDIIDGQRLCAG